ncbi:MAG: DUF5012 domain-containing protein [Salinivirgaceae bacterium]|nr:DUF5012 domain-containing protein [Salinivirgaceae bacterium]
MRTNIIIKSLFVALLAFGLGSCEKPYDTEGLSKVTYYPDFTMTGESVIFINLGGTYTEPGVIAEENGSEITVTTSVVGDFFSGSVSAVNTNTADKYILTYTATNSDGYSGNVAREVYVVSTGDLTSSIEGLYTTSITRNGTTSAQYTDLSYVMIQKTGANTYAISDAIGGYYDLGRGYGAGYRATGLTITANNIAANDFSFSGPVGVGAFGGSCEMTLMSVDATAKTVSFTSVWDAGYTFEVVLKQVQL